MLVHKNQNLSLKPAEYNYAPTNCIYQKNLTTLKVRYRSCNCIAIALLPYSTIHMLSKPIPKFGQENFIFRSDLQFRRDQSL